jgi:hypothetical protein
LPRPPDKLLPLGKIPPAFVLTLAPLAQFWERSARKIPLPSDSDMPVTTDLMACEDMAEAVLAALRGKQHVHHPKQLPQGCSEDYFALQLPSTYHQHMQA